MQTSENNLDRAHTAAMQSQAISDRSDLYNDKFNDFLIVRTIENIPYKKFYKVRKLKNG